MCEKSWSRGTSSGMSCSWNQLGNALDINYWPVLSLRPGVVCGEVVGPRQRPLSV